MRGDEMSSTAIPKRNPLSLTTLVLGILAFVVYFVGGFTLDLWPYGLLLSIVTVVTWIVAKARRRADRPATIGLVLAVIPLAWFAVFIILGAMGVISIE
jgi:hypothetical protein